MYRVIIFFILLNPLISVNYSKEKDSKYINGEKEIANRILNRELLTIDEFFLFVKDNFIVINTMYTLEMGYVFNFPTLMVHYDLEYFDFYLIKILDSEEDEVPIIVEVFVKGKPFTIVDVEKFLNVLLYNKNEKDFIRLIDEYDYFYKQFKKDRIKEDVLDYYKIDL